MIVNRKYFDYYEDTWYINQRYWKLDDHHEYDTWFEEALEYKEKGQHLAPTFVNLYGGIQKKRKKFEQKKDYIFDGNPEGDEE